MSSEDIELISEKASAKILIQSEDSGLGLNWTGLNFEDTSWQSGQTGIGFERIAGDFDDLINFPILEMRGKNSSCLMRIPFEIFVAQRHDQRMSLIKVLSTGQRMYT